ncbi:unnamed protein product [Zymoseptoria tritici ST99CH_1E4]|uniref:Uncharacterized protein n=1 Tax=Zymoseptoria tritici ST99CH_1E4 TaxID=1276532 RepID=A0A2H1H4F7_ZYMTR|nr:unnamed protein product [Zymoseptoria tritici ST99CH_1E4]
MAQDSSTPLMGKVWTYAGGPGSSIYMFTQADPSQPTYELSCSFRTGDTLSCFAPNNPAINLLEVVTYAQPYGDILWIGDDLFYQFKAKSYKFVCAGGNSGIASTTIRTASFAAVDTGTSTTTASSAAVETTAPATTTAFFEAVATKTTAGNMPTCADFLLMVFDDSGEYLAHLNDQDGAIVHSVTAVSDATRYRIEGTRLIDTTTGGFWVGQGIAIRTVPTADPDNGSLELNCQSASDATLSCFDPVSPQINQLQTVSYGSVVGNALFIAEQGKVADAVDRQYKYICPAPSQPATTTKPAASAPTCGGEGRFRLTFGDVSYLQNIPLYVYATDIPDQATRFALKGTTLVDPSNYDLPWLTGMSAGNGPVDAGLPHSAPDPNIFVPIECSLREGFELYCQHPFSNGAIHDLQFCTDGAYGNLLLLANGPFVAGSGCEPIVLTAECVTPPEYIAWRAEERSRRRGRSAGECGCKRWNRDRNG